MAAVTFSSEPVRSCAETNGFSGGLTGRRDPVPRRSLGDAGRSPLYDLVMRLPIVGWFAYLALHQAVGLAAAVGASSRAVTLVTIADLAARVSVLCFLVGVVVMAVFRSRPVGRAAARWPRFAAFARTFSVGWVSPL